MTTDFSEHVICYNFAANLAPTNIEVHRMNIVLNRVRFSHIRANTSSGERVVTIARVFDPTGTYLLYAISVCNPSEPFLKSKGRDIAVDRLVRRVIQGDPAEKNYRYGGQFFVGPKSEHGSAYLRLLNHIAENPTLSTRARKAVSNHLGFGH